MKHTIYCVYLGLLFYIIHRYINNYISLFLPMRFSFNKLLVVSSLAECFCALNANIAQ